MHGQIRFASDEPLEAIDGFLYNLKHELLKVRPVTLDAQASEIIVRGGFFRLVPNWNLLATVTSATIRATPGAQKVLVTYEIRLTHLLRICAALSMVFLVITLLGSVLGSDPDMSSVVAIGLGTQFLVWGWLFGLNYMLIGLRFRRLLRRIARSTLQAEQHERH